MMRTKEDIEVPMKTVMMRLTALVAALAVIVPALAGCSAKTMDSIAIYTGGVAGTYYPLGQALAEIINSELDGVEGSAVVSGGSVANAGAIAGNQAGLALVQNDIAAYAYNGTEMFAGSRVENIRGIASWYPETVQFVVLKETGIQSITGLLGMTVGVGAPGSGTAVEALAILAAAGIDHDNTTILELDFQAVASGLQDGTIDAGCIVAGIPTPAVVDIAGAVSILDIPDGIYDALREQHPFFVRQSVPAAAYDGLDGDVDTVAVMSMLVTSADLAEETVYRITRALFENLGILVAAHESAGAIQLDTALTGMSIPLHPGAERYYLEKGLIE